MVSNQRRRFLKSIAAAGTGLVVAGPTTAAEQERYIVTGNGGGVADRLEREGFAVENEIAAANVFVVVGQSDAADDLRAISGVSGVTPDFAYEVPAAEPESVPEDADYADEQWDKHLTDAFDAHDVATGDGTQLAILDTGMDYEHPDIAPNLNTDDSRAFVDGEETTDGRDYHYHGTHVGGIAAGAGEGIVGMAPDAELVSLRTFPKEPPYLASISDSFLALDYAAELGVDAVNMSIGSSPEPPQTNSEGFRVSRERVVRSVVRRGTSVVTSAGNDATNLQHGGWVALWGSLQGTVSASATDADDQLASFSNYGTGEIDVAAPGVSVLSSIPVDFAEQIGFPRPYGLLSGTTMSSPQVTGLVGLVKELDPQLNPSQVERAIKDGAELSDGESHPEYGAGRVNALNTVDGL
jgi:subtilisin family serine protease